MKLFTNLVQKRRVLPKLMAITLTIGASIGANLAHADDLELTIPVKGLVVLGAPSSATGTLNIIEDPDAPEINIIPSFSINTDLQRAVFANLLSASSTDKPVTLKGPNTNNCTNVSINCIFEPDSVDF